MSLVPQGCYGPTHKPSPEMVREELKRILSSPIFSKSARLTAFLQYVVEQALVVGNSANLKESVLALELYNRDGDFDTRLDPIVRVDARRLRDKLREFYTAAPNEAVIISLPKGSYVPVFETGSGSQTTAATMKPVPESKSTSGARKLLRPIIWIVAAVALTILTILFYSLRSRPQVTPELRPIASLPGPEGWPSLSPDGNFIAFAWSGPPDKPDPGIYIKAVDSDGLRRLTSGYGPAWSPDGRDIAFLRGESDRGSVFVMSQIGGPERRVADSATDVGWLPDSETLIVRGRDPGAPERYALFSISLKTLESHQLTHAPTGMGDWRFAASPDGKTLAFVRYGILGVGDIYLMSLAGGVPRRLTAWNGRFGGLAWTPDGQEIVFSVEEPAGPRLWRVSAASPPDRGVRLAESTGNAEAPVIARSNSGRSIRLAYLETREQIGLRLIDLTSPHTAGVLDAGRIFQRSSRVDTQGQLSPKGDRVAFLSNRTGPTEIWISALDGSGLRRLTHLREAGTNFPAWSPDGQMIAFISSAGGIGTKSVFVVDAKGGPPRRITESSTVGPPRWSGDGHRIYFMSDRSGAYQIWRMAPTGARAEQITRKGGFEAQESPDGKCLYYADQPPRGASGFEAPVKLMQVPVDGGEATVVLPQIWALHWSVTRDGIYYLSPGPPKALLFYRFALARTELVGNLPDQSIRLAGITTVSRDGRWLMLSQVDLEDTDLMLVDNFR
jgi:Tol biopolymer transport system component